MQRSSRDPSVDFYEHSTARGSTPGVDYFHSVSARRARRHGGLSAANASNDSSSVSGGVLSRSASQLTAMRHGDMSAAHHHHPHHRAHGSDSNNNLTSDPNKRDADLQDDEDLADEVPARHLSIIEVARQMLLPVFYERLLDRQSLIATCGAVLDSVLNAEQESGHAVDANQPLTEKDITMVQRLVDSHLREIYKKRPQQASDNSLAGDMNAEAGSSAAAMQQRQQQLMMMRHRGAGADPSSSAAAAMTGDADADALMMDGELAASVGHGGRVSGGRRQDAFGRAGDGETTLSESGASGSSSSFPSIFQSVTYSARGPLPPAPPPSTNGLAASDAFLRVQLDKPHLTTSNSDIVITGVAHTKARIDLAWWIGFGDMSLVIDLEKLRSIGAVGTFQVSHSAFILSIGAGTLIPGAAYTVHLRASATDFGVSKDARIQFVMPVAEDETQDILWKRLQRMTGSGYSGDTEKGVLSLRPDPARMRELDQEYHAAKEQAKQQVELKERATLEKQREKDRRWQILAASKAGKIDSATASKLLMSGQGLPPAVEQAMKELEEAKKKAAAEAGAAAAAAANRSSTASGDAVPNMPGTNLADAAVLMATGASTVRGLTYHEQLKNFVINEVEPVYTLCASPRFTHEAFTGLLRTVVKAFWNARPAGTGILDAPLKKQFLAELRKEIAQYVQSQQSKQLVAPLGAAGSGSPEAAKLLQGALEKVGPEADLASVSLLSPEQRARLGTGGRRSAPGVGMLHQ